MKRAVGCVIKFILWKKINRVSQNKKMMNFFGGKPGKGGGGGIATHHATWCQSQCASRNKAQDQPGIRITVAQGTRGGGGRRVAGMRTTSSRHHMWRPDFFFFSMPQVICLGKVRFSGTK